MLRQNNNAEKLRKLLLFLLAYLADFQLRLLWHSHHVKLIILQRSVCSQLNDAADVIRHVFVILCLSLVGDRDSFYKLESLAYRMTLFPRSYQFVTDRRTDRQSDRRDDSIYRECIASRSKSGTNVECFCSILRGFRCFGGRIWKFAKLDRSMAAFSTTLSGFRFSLKNPESWAPMLIYLTMGGAWTIRLVFSFPIIYSCGSVIQRRQNEHFTASLLRYPNGKVSIIR